ncbi:sigma-70 family RNA polymerase sigma factor [Lederbergia sp. NSJ-179]|uniref:sigma-70 family RNA polymerase sigma factor n=1 Tax=Lederbergia sp. NSJ-179 TaxID=2931402 RepID=UPI001FD11A0B|nr:sigma-70 family RNA polymerase sigma factor [Lederbergia sp. NSJ-179]MCJ7842411.1 sigma-70 family RNA polymerase sigma factor [Lederbergia sp. NSJ-179]
MVEKRVDTSSKTLHPTQHALGQNLMAMLPQLQQYCHYLSQSKWDGEDIAQEVIVKALKHYAHRDEISPALLKKMAYNLWIDTVRKRKYETSTSLTELEENPKDTSSVIDVVDFLIRELTPKQAVMVMLKDGFQFQVKEIANLMDTSEVAVKATLYRARKRLEKRHEEKKSFSNELYWDDEEREQLYELFHQAVKSQDPTVLIHAIPTIRILTKETGVPYMVLQEKYAYSNYSPSSTLSMAA